MKENREHSYCANLQSFIIIKLHRREIDKPCICLVTRIYVVESSRTKLLQWPLEFWQGTSLALHFCGNWTCQLSFVKWWYLTKSKLTVTAGCVGIQLRSLAPSQRYLYTTKPGEPNDRALNSCSFYGYQHIKSTEGKQRISFLQWSNFIGFSSKHPAKNSGYFRKEIGRALANLQEKCFWILSKSHTFIYNEK